MNAELTYAIKFVSDMEKAIAFHQNKLGLKLRFQTPGWSEFETGDVTLALHPATPENPNGSVQLGYKVADLRDLYARRAEMGLEFTSPPREEHGTWLARFRDADGAECSISQ